MKGTLLAGEALACDGSARISPGEMAAYSKCDLLGGAGGRAGVLECTEGAAKAGPADGGNARPRGELRGPYWRLERGGPHPRRVVLQRGGHGEAGRRRALGLRAPRRLVVSAGGAGPRLRIGGPLPPGAFPGAGSAAKRSGRPGPAALQIAAAADRRDPGHALIEPASGQGPWTWTPRSGARSS